MNWRDPSMKWWMLIWYVLWCIMYDWKLFVLCFWWLNPLQNEVFFQSKEGLCTPGKSKSTKPCCPVDYSLFGLGLSGCICILINNIHIYYRTVYNHLSKYHMYWTFYPCHLSQWLMGTRLNRPSTCSRTPLFFFLIFQVFTSSVDRGETLS